MSVFRVPRAATRQPRGAPRINRANPATRGLHFLSCNTDSVTPVNLIANARPTTEATNGKKVTRNRFGTAITYPDPPNDADTWTGGISGSPGITASTMMWVGLARGNSSYSSTTLHRGYYSGGDHMQIKMLSFELGIEFSVSYAYSSVAITDSTAPTQNGFYVCIGVLRPDKSMEFWVNGKSIGTNTAADFPRDWTTLNNVIMGGPEITMAAASWTRDLPRATIESLSKNPWQLFEGDDLAFFAASGAATITATANLGAAIAAAQSATASAQAAIQAERSLSASIDAYIQSTVALSAATVTGITTTTATPRVTLTF